MLQVAAAARSECGQRHANEDRVQVSQRGTRWLAVLADGAGGHAGGAQASRCAVESLVAALERSDVEFSASSLTQAVRWAHAQVQRAQGDSEDGLARMHSTLVVLWLDTARDSALWSHVGDSRLYRVRRGVATLLTSDDSVVQRMVDAGLITAAQAESHPQKNQLIAALGIEDGVEPHTIPSPHGLLEGDSFLLCSDGWWGALDDETIAAAVDRANGPDEWLMLMQQVIETLAAPRQDNFSAIAVWVRDPIDSTRPMAMD